MNEASRACSCNRRIQELWEYHAFRGGPRGHLHEVWLHERGSTIGRAYGAHDLCPQKQSRATSIVTGDSGQMLATLCHEAILWIWLRWIQETVGQRLPRQARNPRGILR